MVYIKEFLKLFKEKSDHMNPTRIEALEQAICRDYGNMAGLVVRCHNAPVFERYYHTFAPTDAAHLFSVTKSIVSLLIGIALDKGYLKSLDQRVLDFFPDYPAPAAGDTIHTVTLRHLLTMTAPYKCEAEPYEAFFSSPNWVKFALDLLGGDKPAGDFFYSPIVGTHILGGVLTSATGRSVLDFATEYLFSPLGIQVQTAALPTREAHMAWSAELKKTSSWVADSQGINTASWGLSLTPGDLANLGQLCLNGGSRNGRQVVSKAWIKDSTSVHARWNGLGYGFLWWAVDERAHSFAALGDGGNALYVDPAKDLVVAVTSLFTAEAKDPLELILSQIAPAFAD